MNTSINKQTRYSLVAALLLVALSLVSCEPKEPLQPPQKEPTEKMKQWNDYVNPDRHPPRIDTTLIKGG